MTSLPIAVTPTLPLLGLTPDEKTTIETLEARGQRDRADMQLRMAYYLGEYVVQNLRIAIPKELEFLQPLLGWPSMAVNPYVERLSLDSFRRTDATDGDQDLMDIMDANGFAAEQSLAFTDALAMRRAYWMVGSGAAKDDAPVITVESPLNMTVLWDLRGTTPRAAIQEYWDRDGVTKRGTLLVPGKTVHLATNDNGQWVVVDRDEHSFDFVPIVRMANRALSNNRDGRSEITPELMFITDAACRTLLGLEVARELYSVPQKIILGAAEGAFVKADGSPASAWDTYINKTLGLERDAEGELPQFLQAKPYDPSVFTKLIEMYASQAGGIVGALPQELGLYTQGNPVSPEALQAQEHTRSLRSVNMQSQFTPPLIEVAKMAMRFTNRGVLPNDYKRLSADWNPVTMPTPGVTSDAVTKEVQVGAIPPTSDVTLKRLGYSAVDRARLAIDREADGAQSLLSEIATNLQVKQARSDLVAIKDAAPVTAEPVPGATGPASVNSKP